MLMFPLSDCLSVPCSHFQGFCFTYYPLQSFSFLSAIFIALTVSEVVTWLCSLTSWWDPTWSPASSSGALSTRRTWTCWTRSRGGPQKWSEGWSISPARRKAERVGAIQPEEEKAAGGHYCWRGPIGKVGTIFLARPVEIRQGVTDLN